MREIKFRVWDRDDNEMLDWADIHGKSFHTGLSTWAVLSGTFKHLMTMQYTGLKDSKGVEIYEGDIVQDDIKGKDVKGVVEYREEETAFVVAKEAATCRLMFWCIDGCTVIGNRFQHPDLLQDKGEE